MNPIELQKNGAKRIDRSRLIVIIVLICIFIYYIPSVFSQENADEMTGWDEIPVPERVNLRDVVSLNSNTALAVGEGGKMFFTNSSGKEWFLESTGTTQNLNCIDYAAISPVGKWGNGIVIAAGDSGTVIISEQGGTWEDHSITGGSDVLSISIARFDSVNGSLIFTAGRNGEIWKYDSNVWTQMPSGVLGDLYGINFLNDTYGIAVGANGVIIGTDNAGKSWETRGDGVSESARGLDFYTVEFAGEIPPPTGECQYPSCTVAVRAYVAGEEGIFIKSSAVWDEKNEAWTTGSALGYVWYSWDTGTNETIRSISTFSGSINKVWIAGDNSLISYTRDGGNSFNNQNILSSLNTTFSSVDMTAGESALIASGFLVGGDGIALYTDKDGVLSTVPTVQTYKNFWEFANLMYPQFLQGLMATLRIIGYSILLGFSLGLIFAICKTSPLHINIPVPLLGANGWGFFSISPLKILATIYTDIFRNTPLLVQFLFIHFGLAEVGIDLTFGGVIERAYVSAILTLGLNSGAYQTEIIRSGIQAIPTGQLEAGRSLGLTYLQTMRYVIMPQAIRIVIPPLGNETVNLVLNSSLASSIGYGELTRQGKLVIAITFKTFWTWGLVLIFYFSITYTLTNLLKYAERKLKIPGLGIGGET